MHGKNEYLINMAFESAYGTTALMAAAIYGQVDIISYLFEQGGAKIDEQDNYERTALMMAAEKGHLNTVQWLVKKGGAEIDKKDQYKKTALILAAQKNHLNIVQWLVEEGKVDINGKDEYGYTALMWATYYGYFDVARWLIEVGKAKVDEKSITGETALMLAAKEGHLDVVKCLVEVGKTRVDEKDRYGKTALMLAAKEGYLPVVRYLVETARANLYEQDCWWTVGIFEWSERLEVVRYIEEQILMMESMTPFLFAVKQSQVNEVISYKLQELSYPEIRQAWNFLLDQTEPNHLIKDCLKTEVEHINKILADLNAPSELFCPISLELMLDPVIGSDTYTYERKSIEQALLIKEQSPMTRIPMYKEDLHSNQFVKGLIKKIIEKVDLIRKEQENDLNGYYQENVPESERSCNNLGVFLRDPF